MRALPLMASPVAACLLALPPAAGQARAQGAPAPDRIIEIATRDRWLYRDQDPRLVPFSDRVRQYVVDSIVGTTSGREVYLSAPDIGQARLVLGRFVTDARFIRLPQPGTARWRRNSSQDSLRAARAQVVVAARGQWPGPLDPPEFQIREAARVFLSEPATSLDTLRAESGGATQRLRTAGASYRLSDTALGGRRLRVFRDTASVELEEEIPSFSLLLQGDLVISRAGQGTSRSRVLLDNETGLAVMVSDTLVIEGNAAWHHPDGRVFDTPARFERMRTVRLLTSQEARQRALARATAEAERFRGVVESPGNSLEQRLAAGDTSARDSLLRAWQATEDPDLRERMASTLRWARGLTLDSLEVAAGDTARLFRSLSARIGARPLAPADVESIISWTDNPRRYFAYQLNPDGLVEELVAALSGRPPAVTADTSRWPCERAACELLAGYRTRGREALTRELGLIAAFSTDPRRWLDSVRIHAQRWPGLYAELLAYPGIGMEPSLPSPGEDWHRWLTWVEPVFNGSFDSSAVARVARQSFKPDQSEVARIRMAELLTSRRITAEISRRYASAGSDSARLVFGSLLLALDAWKPDRREAERHARSRSPALVALGQEQARLVVERQGVAAPPEVLNRLFDQLLAEEVARSESASHFPTFVDPEGVPETVRERWAARVRFLSDSGWKHLPDGTGNVVLSIHVGRMAGPFVSVLLHESGQQPGRFGNHWFSETSQILMRSGRKWVVVGRPSFTIT